EEIVFGQKTTGAGNDIERATELARAMVTEWGMSDEFGPLNYAGSKQEVFLGRDFQSSERLSEETAQRIDSEIRRVGAGQYERAKQILSQNRDALEKVSDALLEYETIDGDDIENLIQGGKIDRPLPKATRPPTAGTTGPKDEEARGKRPLLSPKGEPEPEPV